MAEDIAADIITKIIEKLGSAAFKKIKFVKDLESHIERLREIKSIIAAELHRFDPLEVSTDLEGKKIERLRRLHDELVYFFDVQEARTKQKEVMGGSTITTQARLFFSSSNQLVLPFSIAEKVNAITKELKSIANDYAQYSSIVSHSSGNQNRCTSSKETSSFPDTAVLIGRDRDKENIVNMICNSSKDQVVAIVGVGGQGKTTLAQFVCQDDRVKGSFDKRLWVSLTPKSRVNEILEKIIISATGEKPIYCGLEQLHLQVLQAIDGKKCLLVLDNVYYVKNLRDDSEALSAILKQGCFWRNGGKVLITSRSEKVAEQMSTPKPYKLRDLAEDDCWILLQHYAMKQEPEDKKEFGALVEIGKEIAKMCPKMPLVLKTIGCYLADNDHKIQWESFKNKLASNPTVYMSNNENIKQILKLCYDQLDYNLKHCAAFCSLFPKGHVYHKNYMVRNWIDLGFVEPREGMSLEDVGDSYVVELKQRAFFEEAGNFEVFKMHDVMHDLMLLIGKDKHQIIDSKTKDIAERVRHVSLNMQDLNWEVLLSSISVSGKQTLESILLVSPAWDNRAHGVPLSSGMDRLILACQKLKVLEIYDQCIKNVPKSIGELTLVSHLNMSGNLFCTLPNEITKMVNLLTLDLSECYNLQELPTKIGKLKNLLSLNLEGCWDLKELPSDMRKLVKLRHLRIKECDLLKCMPEGFGNLTELETLDMFIVGESSRSSRGLSKAKAGAKLKELGHLNRLKGHLCIKLTGASKDIVSEAGEAHLEKKTKLTKLEIIFEKSAEEDEKFLEGIQLWGENFEEVSILNYGGNRLPVWMTDDRFHKRFPKLDSFVLGGSSFIFGPTPGFIFRPTPAFYEEDESMRINVEGNEDELVEWVPRYSRIKEHLKMGTVKLSFETRRRDGPRLADPRDLTFHKVYLRIENELAPRSSCGLRRQPDFFLKSCFPNLICLELMDIPELEVLPEEFRDLSSLEYLMISQCPKLKAIPDWIGTLSSLKTLYIINAPEVKVLPDSIGSLTSLSWIWLYDFQGLECLPRHVSNLPESCQLHILRCSTELLKKCAKQTGEYWPYLQHLQSISVRSSEGDELRHWRPTDYASSKEDEVSNVTATALISQSSHNEATPLTLEAVPSHSKLLSLKNGLLLFFVVVVVVVISLSLF